MSHKRKVLLILADELSVPELQSIASALEVTHGRTKAALVQALVSSRTAGLANILSFCSRKVLKQICTHLELSDAGKNLDVLIARIVDVDDLGGFSVPALRVFLTEYLRVPDELSQSERMHVTRQFAELMEQASPKGLQAARPIVAPAAARLRKAKALWKHRVAELAERLAALAEGAADGPDLAGEEMQAVVAAVRYFATSESVLPDWDARTAIDDAYVFDLCHAKLARPALLAISGDLSEG